ncbi:MAG: Glycosyl transferase, group 2 family [Nitrospira sp.]|jgi:cellulose synthase/poly-beta-1,6-N-acetylglucosamine synthase-like glycosyltransferase|nr:MAG: Glycosyl transferase, group 2 family [Nitrospira sp.]
MDVSVYTQCLFWLSLAFIFYAYAGYPLMLLLLSAIRNRPVQAAPVCPRVSFIITAYNEEKRIHDKLTNTLRLDYPRDRMEIVVASDCSTDGTDDIVRSFQTSGVRLIRSNRKGGKEAAQQLAVESTDGEILVFSDTATILEPQAVSSIVKNFADESVGCVSSVDRFIDGDGAVSGEGAYVRYEMWLRKLETRVNTLVGLSGSFFAARRTVCREWAPDLQSDFNTLLSSVRLGLRGVADPDSVGYYHNLLDQRKEYERKVRTVVRGISVFMRSVSLLNPLRYHLFAWQLFSHKLCRWLVPFAMIAALVANGWLALSSPVYRAILLVQAGFYSLALVYMLSRRVPSVGMLRIPSFFVMVNLSILDAWMRYFRGERIVSWTPSKR